MSIAFWVIMLAATNARVKIISIFRFLKGTRIFITFCKENSTLTDGLDLNMHCSKRYSCVIL